MTFYTWGDNVSYNESCRRSYYKLRGLFVRGVRSPNPTKTFYEVSFKKGPLYLTL